MRVHFYTATALAALVANISSAVRLNTLDYGYGQDSLYEFSQLSLQAEPHTEASSDIVLSVDSKAEVELSSDSEADSEAEGTKDMTFWNEGSKYTLKIPETIP